jgi:hypothetical protein
MERRDQLIALALEWQERYGAAPSITPVLPEFDAENLVGMPGLECLACMQDKTAVSRGHVFI